MTHDDWDKEITKTETGKLGDIRLALSILHDWKPFRETFTYTGLFTVSEMVKQELELRNMRVLKRLTDEKGCKQ